MPLKKKRANQPDDQADADELQKRLAEEQQNDEEAEDDEEADEDDDDIAEDGGSSDDDDEDEDEEDGLEGTYDGNEEIQVDFEGRNPIDIDFHGIRQLLRQLLLRAPVNLSELADEIIGQNYVGSVVTQCQDDEATAAAKADKADAGEEDDEEADEDEDDEPNTVFGITTAINLTHKSDRACVQALRQHLIQRAEQNTGSDSATLQTVRRILSNASQSVGFLLNERFVNIPPQISVPLLENLAKEVEKAAAKGMPYQFEHYVMLVKMYRSAPTTKKSKKAAKAEDEFYTNAEEEVFVERALCTFEYSVRGEALKAEDEDEEEEGGADGDHLAAAAAAASDESGLVPWRKLVIFEASKLPSMIEAIKQMIEA